MRALDCVKRFFAYVTPFVIFRRRLDSYRVPGSAAKPPISSTWPPISLSSVRLASALDLFLYA